MMEKKVTWLELFYDLLLSRQSPKQAMSCYMPNTA